MKIKVGREGYCGINEGMILQMGLQDVKVAIKLRRGEEGTGQNQGDIGSRKKQKSKQVCLFPLQTPWF